MISVRKDTPNFNVSSFLFNHFFGIFSNDSLLQS